MEDHLLKYARMAVPRYTSYPTALQFGDGIGPEEYQGWLREIKPDQPISLYVHIPFCQSLCWYCGCNTTVPNTYDRVENYLQALKSEILLTAENISTDVSVSHLHFGGGTPSYLSPVHFEQLTALITNVFNFTDDAELAVEADPRALPTEIVTAFAKSGITRVSLGVQDFNPDVQKLINRIQSEELVSRCVSELKANDIKAINFDLMYGLPGQSVETVQQSAIIATRMQPDRIAVFGYAHVPWFKKHQQVIQADMLPGIEQRIEQADVIADTLQEHGYIRIGLDHFAKPTDDLAIALTNGTLRRNFQGYTTDRATTLIGFGASSISTLPHGYCQNDPHTGRYISKLDAMGFATVRGLVLSDEDKLRRAAINALMCDFTLDMEEICALNQQPPDALDDSLPALLLQEKDGLIQLKGRLVVVTPKGRRFIRNIAAGFDRYLQNNEQKHSLAV